MKKCILYLGVLCSILAFCTGCGNSYKAFTYSVETGDSIKVKLDTSAKYNITAEIPFQISCDGQVLSQGMFIEADAYNQYVDVISADASAVLLDSGTKDGNDYIFWSYGNSEFDYAILIKNSNTGVVLGNNVSEETARECFKRITVGVAD